jgi:hypothetical protein
VYEYSGSGSGGGGSSSSMSIIPEVERAPERSPSSSSSWKQQTLPQHQHHR